MLVDAGPDAYQQLLAAGAVPDQVLLTHHHHDHVLGLHALAKLGRIPLHCTKECEQGVRVIFPRLDFRVMQVTPGVPIELGHGLRAQAFDVDHSGRTRTVAYRFTGPGRRVARLRPRPGRAAGLEARPRAPTSSCWAPRPATGRSRTTCR